MMQEITFEFKKYVMTKNHFVIILMLTLAGMGILISKERGYFLEKNIRQDFYSKAGQSFSATDKQKFIAEKEKLEQEIYKETADGMLLLDKKQMEQKGNYADTKIEDYELLNELLECMEVVEKRNRNTALVVENIEGASLDYEKENNHMLVDRKKLNAVVGNMTFGWLPCLALIILLSASFAVEYENNLSPVLCITKKGKWSISMSKIVTGIMLAVVLNFYFWGVYFISQMFLLNMTVREWGESLFLVDGYQMCASGFTIQGLLAKQIIASILVSVLLAMFTMVLSKLIKRSIYTLLVALGFFGVTLIPDLLNTVVYSNTYVSEMSDWYLVSEPAFYRLLNIEKICNPVSMLQFHYYVEQPRYIQIAGFQYPLYCFPVIVAFVFIGMWGIVLFYEKSGRCKK